MLPKKTIPRLAAAGAAGAAAILLAACGSGTPSSSATGSSGASASASSSASASALAGGTSCSSSATKLTFWAWVPGMDRAVNEFNKTHPDICVTLEDPGAGDVEYTALNNTLKAGTGAPDVAEIEFDELPSFEIQHYLVNLVPYGANSDKSKFASWAWGQVSQGSAVYAMPSDWGPMGFYYDQQTLAKYHLTPPATWTQLASDAVRLHGENSSAYLMNFNANDPQWLMDMMAQAGAWPYSYSSGADITIDWTGPKQEAFAAFWQKLIDDKAVGLFNDAGTEVDTNLDNGTLASAIDSAWAPSYFVADAKKSLGQWRAASIPQWTAGAGVNADWGGSTYPVFTQSKHPQQAATFAEWLTATDASWNILKTPSSSLFPTYLPTLQSASFKSLTYPVSGSSQPNQVFSPSAQNIPQTPWPPFMTEVLNQQPTTFGGVLNAKETLQQAFAAFQQQEVAYAKSQGFNVST
jgi:multiple sugar transport system substrate-binding protein